MEITLEAIISLLGIFVGGGSIGGFLFWRQTKRKAAAEAKLAEAEAKLKEAETRKAEIEADKEQQDYYQQLARDLAEDREDRKRQNVELRAERDHYKKERDDLRDVVQKLEDEVREIREKQSKREIETDQKIAQMGRRLDAALPLLCGRSVCAERVFVTLSADGEVRPRKNQKKEKYIEPNNEEL